MQQAPVDLTVELPRPPSLEDFEFSLPKSTLGIYSKAAVATDTRPCGGIGVEILRQHGTAVDAAIAVLACNGAVHPHSLGLGGGFFMTIFVKSENKTYFLNARETAPQAAHETMFTQNPLESQVGPKSIAVPGELLGYVEAKERFGNDQLSLMDLLEPTIQLCQNGIKVTRSLEKAMKASSKKLDSYQGLRDEFTNPATGKLYKMNEIMKREKFAETLTKIGESGSDIIYKGELGEQIVKEIQDGGGIITMKDLENYK